MFQPDFAVRVNLPSILYNRSLPKRRNIMCIESRILAIALCVSSVSLAQDTGLQLRVLIGHGGLNVISEKTAVSPVLQLVDGNGKPVPGAKVTFRAPTTGPSVTFYRGSRLLTMTTDDDGEVRIVGILPNAIVGSFQIEIEARIGEQVARTAITQSNVSVAPAATSSTVGTVAGVSAGKAAGISLPVIVAIGAAAAVGVVVAVAKGGGSNGGGGGPSVPPVPRLTIRIGSGPPVVGAP